MSGYPGLGRQMDINPESGCIRCRRRRNSLIHSLVRHVNILRPLIHVAMMQPLRLKIFCPVPRVGAGRANPGLNDAIPLGLSERQENEMILIEADSIIFSQLLSEVG